LQKKAIEVIRDRLELANPSQREEILLKAVSKIKLGSSINNLPSATPFTSEMAKPFNLDTLDSLINGL
jgi:hypothetical protein